MTRDEIKEFILETLKPRIEQTGLRTKDIKPGLDMVSSGFVNSMEFVELIAGIEEKTGVEIDYEKALEDESFTTLDGILNQFDNLMHE